MKSSTVPEMTKVKKHLNDLKEFLFDTCIFILGGVGMSLAVNCFLAKNGILYGGFSGIATILNFLFDIPIGTAIFVMNIPLFLIALKKLGGKFIKRTIWATFVTSIIIDSGFFLPVYSNDLLLSSVIGGALVGVSLGIIFIRNATTGGIDIIAKLIQINHPHFSFGKSVLIFDGFVILLGGIVYRNIDAMLYAAVVTFVSAQVIDYVIYGISRGATIMVITEKGDEICHIILNDFNRGVTVLKGQGGYSKQEKEVLLCACYDNQTQKFIKKIKSADENAFFIVTQSKQILGNGFRNNI